MNIETATAQQREAITTDAHRVLVLAGPGSGKTATTVARIHHLIYAVGTTPSEIVAITFTNAAARELEERIAKECGDDVKLGYVGTLHGFCLRMLKEHGGFLGYGARISIISPESAEDLLVSKAKTLGCKTPIKELLKLKDAGRPPRGERLTGNQVVIANYFDDLRDAGIVDFDVLLTEALRLFRDLCGNEFLGFRHLFVDEVQDSSETDWEIYDALVIENKFFVGDPDQAIYAFRGGDVSEMLARCSTHKVIRLEENFRSRSEICEAAQNLIEHNKDRVPKRTWSVKGHGGEVVYHFGKMNEGEELATVTRCIQQFSQAIDPAIEPFKVRAELTELIPSIAVLARTNAIASSFRKGLAAVGIPVVAVQSSGLPKDWPVVRALVEFLSNPENDTLAQFLLISLYEKKGASPKEAREAVHAAKRAANAAGKTLNRANLGFKRRETCADIAQILVKENISAESRMLVAEQLKEVGASASVLDLSLALAQVKGINQESGTGVECMTIHASKGREFDVVFVVGVEEKILPSNWGGATLEEERRLAYVAITRARSCLVITSSATRATPWGALGAQTPSRFIQEMIGGAS